MIRTVRWALVASVVVIGIAAVAYEPPDSEINPVTGNVESVSQSWMSGNWNVLHATDSGGDPPVAVILEGTPVDGLQPRIAITASGTSGAVWWTDGTVDEVYFAERDVSGSWSDPSRISAAGVDGRAPEIVAHGSDFWLAYESFDGGGGTTVTASGIRDGAEPFPPTSIGETGWGGDLDVRIHSESTALWVTWVHDDVDVGWSAFDAGTETWSLPAYESYAGGDVTSARSRIRSAMLGE